MVAVVTRPAPVRLALVLGVLAGSLLLGCGGEDAAGTRDDTGPKVVATTTQAADLTRQVGAGRAQVEGLLTPNSDPHEYEVRPSDLDALSGAAVVVRSGGDLDAWLGDAIQGAGGDPTQVSLIDAVRTRGDDPHWWQDPRNAQLAVARIRDALVAADPAGAATYRANAARSISKLKALDTAVATCMARVPAARRKLVTTHDALGYYAARYGIEVVGAVIPSLSTKGQPSAGETAALVQTIRAQGVRAIFAESSVNPKLERAIAKIRAIREAK